MGTSVVTGSPETVAEEATPAVPAEVTLADLRAFAQSIPVEPIEVDGLGMVYVRGMTADQGGRIAAMYAGKQVAKVGPSVACYCLCDRDGNRLLQDSQLPEVMAWPNKIVFPVMTKALELSGLDLDTEEMQGN